MGEYPDMIFVLVLCLAMGVALSFFFCYHASLVYRNQTTNEINKLSDLQYRLEKNLEEHQKLLHDLEHKQATEAEIKQEEQRVAETTKKISKIETHFYDHGLRQNLREIFNPHHDN